MVFYFTAKNGYTIYMGKDKHENEELIKYGWPEDIWCAVPSCLLLIDDNIAFSFYNGRQIGRSCSSQSQSLCQLLNLSRFAILS